MILIKDRHYSDIFFFFIKGFLGNMILIKDRHWNMYQQMVSFQIGKYDTYKGSTPSFKSSALKLKDSGKYDTYKGSTRQSMNKR